MNALGRWLAHRRWVVLLTAVLLTTAALIAPPLGYDDDVVRFLPQDDVDVQAFQPVIERFGGLDIALVGVEATGEGGIFTPETLAYCRALSRHLATLPVVDFVTSITELSVVTGSDAADLVALVPDPLPTDPAALIASRDRVLGLDYVAGSLVSRDGNATLMVLKLRPATSIKEAAEQVSAAAGAIPNVTRPNGVTLHFGGAPFIAAAAANGSQEDLRRLGPIVAAVILILVMLSLGSWRAAVISLMATALGILWTLGILRWVGQPLTLVSTSLPVLLVALGSAYSVHLLVRYRERSDTGSAPLSVADRLGRTMAAIGWPIVATALTTAAGFMSFLVMDLAPLREFGVAMAGGALVCALVALLVVPALVAVLPVPLLPEGGGAIERWLTRSAVVLRRVRRPVLLGTALVAIGFATQLPNIDTRMDIEAFFEPDSPPARADHFMTAHFGGSVFLQVLVEADLQDPGVLHRLAAFEDHLTAINGVTQIQSIARVLPVVEEGLTGVRRLPRSRGGATQAGYLARQSNKAVTLLVDDTWQGALIQIGIGGFDTARVEPLVAAVEQLAALHLRSGRVVTVQADATTRVTMATETVARLGALNGRQAHVDPALVEALLTKDPNHRAKLDAAVHATLDTEINEEEWVELRDEQAFDPLVKTIQAGVAAGNLRKSDFVARVSEYAAASELTPTNVAGFEKAARIIFTTLDRKVGALKQGVIEARLAELLGPLGAAERIRASAIIAEFLAPTHYLQGAPNDGVGGKRMTAVVTGQPVLQQAMTRSVARNQGLSLAISLPLVLLILVLMFRSLRLGLIGVMPAAFTLLVTFGIMGLMPSAFPMDIGASMLSSIALGVGIDYAIHFLWRYRERDAAHALETTGRAILVNAAQITGGFAVLAFATLAPLSRFGVLTAETLLVAALASLILLPLLLPRTPPGYRSGPM